MLAEQARSDRDGSARFGNQMCLRRGPSHRLAYLVLGDGHDVVHVTEHVIQGQRANLLHPERVGDGPLRVLHWPCHPPAAAERFTRVGGQFRLDPDHPRRGAQRADGGGNPRDEATAADRHDDQVGVGAVRRDLQADGALARYDSPVVEGRDERIAVTADQFVGGGHPCVQRRLGGDNPGTQPADGAELDRRRIDRDDHGGRHIQQRRGIRDGLGMIPAGMGHHPPRAQIGGKGADRRIRATQLERACWLQRLRLHQQAGMRARERHQRGTDGDPGEARGRSPDFVDRYQRRHWPTIWPAGPSSAHVKVLPGRGVNSGNRGR